MKLEMLKGFSISRFAFFCFTCFIQLVANHHFFSQNVSFAICDKLIYCTLYDFIIKWCRSIPFTVHTILVIAALMCFDTNNGMWRSRTAFQDETSCPLWWYHMGPENRFTYILGTRPCPMFCVEGFTFPNVEVQNTSHVASVGFNRSLWDYAQYRVRVMKQRHWNVPLQFDPTMRQIETSITTVLVTVQVIIALCCFDFAPVSRSLTASLTQHTAEYTQYSSGLFACSYIMIYRKVVRLSACSKGVSIYLPHNTCCESSWHLHVYHGYRYLNCWWIATWLVITSCSSCHRCSFAWTCLPSFLNFDLIMLREICLCLRKATVTELTEPWVAFLVHHLYKTMMKLVTF